MNKRLVQFLSAEGLTQAQFADRIGVARASISHILSGRNNPGYDFFLNLAKVFPDLNLDWLLLGKGRMYKQQEAQPATQTVQTAACSASSITDAVTRTEAGLFDMEVELQPEFNAGTTPSSSGQPGPDAALVDKPGSAASLGKQTDSAPSTTAAGKVAETVEIPPQSDGSSQNSQFSIGINTLGKAAQLAAKQRNIDKIIVFFDDGSFEEFSK